MVRFIIIWFIYSRTILPSIYIPIWLDLLSVYRQKDQNQITNLHSNMVRFIIRWTNDSRRFDNDIYIPIWLDLLLKIIFCKYFPLKIYIPIWLYLLFVIMKGVQIGATNLHSNMLDLLSYSELQFFFCFEHLHSNMVRFIMLGEPYAIPLTGIFTFQYG